MALSLPTIGPNLAVPVQEDVKRRQLKLPTANAKRALFYPEPLIKLKFGANSISLHCYPNEAKTVP